MSLFQMKTAHFQVEHVCPEWCLDVGSGDIALLLLRELCLNASPVGRGRAPSAARERGVPSGFLWREGIRSLHFKTASSH